MASKPRKSPKLSREDWVEAALAALEKGGVSAVAVEPLALELGVTKGSFYWHFKDRRALLAATVELWEQRFTLALMDEMKGLTDPKDRLRALLRRAFVEFEPTVLMRLTEAAEDPLIAKSLAAVADLRVDLITTAYEALGMDRKRARSRALIAYSAFLGFSQLRARSTAGLGSRAGRARFVDELDDRLLGDL